MLTFKELEERMSEGYFSVTTDISIVDGCLPHSIFSQSEVVLNSVPWPAVGSSDAHLVFRAFICIVKYLSMGVLASLVLAVVKRNLCNIWYPVCFLLRNYIIAAVINYLK